jgi:hypothetical protein
VHLDWQGKGIGGSSSPAWQTMPVKGADVADVDDVQDVPWNAPFYARLGFENVTELTPELRQKREEETAHGFAPAAPCVCRFDIARWRCAYRAYKTLNRRPGKAQPPPGTTHGLERFPVIACISGRRFTRHHRGATVFAEANSRAFICSC